MQRTTAVVSTSAGTPSDHTIARASKVRPTYLDRLHIENVDSVGSFVVTSCSGRKIV